MFLILFLLLPHILHSQQTFTPGFQFLGKGYDSLMGNIFDTSGNGDPGWREQIFQFSTSQGLKTPDKLWLVPDNTQSMLLSSCSIEQTESILNDGFDYQKSVSVGFGVDLNFFAAAFQFSTDSKHVVDTTFSGESIYAQLESRCAVYQLGMNYYLSPEVSREFLYGVMSLNENYDETAYMTFLKVFGTHYIRTLTLGGRWGWLIEMKRKDFQKILDDRIDWNLGLSYAGKTKAGINLNGYVDSKTLIAVTNAIYQNFSYNVGGDYKPDSRSWMESVRENPMPIRIEPLPIWELLTSKFLPNVSNIEIRQALLKNATLNYCQWLRQTVDPTINCTRPEPLPKIVPNPLDPLAVRGVCVRNTGGYAMSWKLFNNNIQGVYAQSGVFPVLQKECLDGTQVHAENGHILTCNIDIILGLHGFPACEGGVKFDARSVNYANFVCWGTTLFPSCEFEGNSQ